MDELKVKAYLSKLSEDQEFQTQMQNAKNPEEALAVAKAYGFDFELEEFKALMMSVLVSIKQSKGEELTDEELDAVAGGLSTSDWISIGIVSLNFSLGAAAGI